MHSKPQTTNNKIWHWNFSFIPACCSLTLALFHQINKDKHAQRVKAFRHSAACGNGSGLYFFALRRPPRKKPGAMVMPAAKEKTKTKGAATVRAAVIRWERVDELLAEDKARLLLPWLPQKPFAAFASPP
jgi:hypothetical protein